MLAELFATIYNVNIRTPQFTVEYREETLVDFYKKIFRYILQYRENLKNIRNWIWYS